MQHYSSKSTAMEDGFRPLAGLGAKLEEIEASFEAQLASEGMPSEITPTDAASLDGRLAVVTADADATKEVEHSSEHSPEDLPADDSPADTCNTPEPEQPGLTPEDHKILRHLKDLGWAAHPALLREAGASTERLAKLSSLGLAHMRASEAPGGDRVFAMAGATEGDVERAGEWISAQREEARRTTMGSRVHQISSAITARLELLGGACSEEALYGSLLSSHPREAVDAVIAHMERVGELRRVGFLQSPGVLLALPGADKEELNAVSLRLQDLARDASTRRSALRKNADDARKRRRRAPAMRLAEPISKGSSHGEHDDRAEAGSVLKAAPHHFWAIWTDVRERVPRMDYETARERLDELPFKTTLEAAGWESKSSESRRRANLSRMRQECIARRREGRPLVIVPAAELDKRLSSATRSIVSRKRIRRERLRKLFSDTLRRRSPERIALDTARAVLLSRESDESARLLGALRDAPPAALNDSRVLTPVGLTDEGRAVMSRHLLAILADARNGIRVPEGTKLARKVAAYSLAVEAAREAGALATGGREDVPMAEAALHAA